MMDNVIENICDALEKIYSKYVYNKKSKYLHKENCTYVKRMNPKYKSFITLERLKNSPHLQNVKRCSLCMSDDLETQD